MNDDAPDAAARTVPLVKVVGPCKSGKSTLVAGLRAAGFNARSCGQEHSGAPAMWQRIHPPDYLVFLDVSLETMRRRVDRSDWSDDLLAVQQQRLAHARSHADVVIATDEAASTAVLQQVIDFLRAAGV
ncbi:MAG: hypothetical protein ABTQ73_08315 [Caldilineales bacterium]